MAPRRPSAWGSKHRVRLAASSYEAGTDRGHPSADGRGRSVTPRPAPAPATDAKHPAVLVHAGCVRRARRLERAALRAGEAFAEGSGAVGRVMWQERAGMPVAPITRQYDASKRMRHPCTAGWTNATSHARSEGSLRAAA